MGTVSTGRNPVSLTSRRCIIALTNLPAGSALTLSLETLQMDEDRLPTPRASMVNFSDESGVAHPSYDPSTGASFVLPPPSSSEWQT